MKFILTRKEIEEGDKIPWGYGVAWRANYGMKVICYPVVLNVIIRWCVNFYWKIVHGWFQAKWETELLNIRMEVYHDFRERYEERLEYLKSLMKMNSELWKDMKLMKK